VRLRLDFLLDGLMAAFKFRKVALERHSTTPYSLTLPVEFVTDLSLCKWVERHKKRILFAHCGTALS
jgi:hypothetical protein